MRTILLSIVIGVGLLPVGGRATTPAHSPNYCGPAICLELDPASRHVVRTNSVIDTQKEMADMVVSGPEGTMTIHVKKSSLPCRGGERLVLRAAKSAYSGSLLTNGPNEEVCWELHAEYLPSTTAEAMRLALPVTNIWLVDDVPSTFWSGGYALRIGAGIEVFIEPGS
ncbi:hypothetical protein LAG73_10250 [Pseudoxanthomonas japonensis]|nr:hypothetical protein LAG73_10250 [Pseudoxanthomonas japonensis]